MPTTDIVNLSAHLIGTPANGVNLYQVPNASMEVLQDIINATWNEGLNSKAEFQGKIAAALTSFLDITAIPPVSTTDVTGATIVEPVINIPTDIDISQIFSTFQTEYQALASWLTTELGAINAPTMSAATLSTVSVDEPVVTLPTDVSIDSIYSKFEAQYASLAGWLVGQLAGIPKPSMIAAGLVAMTVDEPFVNIPADASVDDIFDKFTTEYIKVATWLAGQSASFLATYFPNDAAAFQAAEAWVRAAIDNPNVGLPETVQQQIWGDDHARITSDKLRAIDAVNTRFAASGFPLPPDVTASMIMQIEQGAQDKLAESSRKIAAMSVELQKWNVEKLIGMHELAVKSAVDYIKALASAPDVVSRMVNIGYDAQSKLISSVAQYYGARTGAKDLTYKGLRDNAMFQQEAAKANLEAEKMMAEQTIKALTLAPEIASRMAGIGIDAQSKLISAISSFYNARIEAKGLEYKAVQRIAELTQEANKANLGSETALMDGTIKALPTSPEIVSRMSGIGYDAQSKLISAAGSFFNARTQAADTKNKITQFNSSKLLEADTTNQKATIILIEDKLKALLAEAQALAQMTTALFNNLHVGVTMQAGGTTVTTQAQTL